MAALPRFRNFMRAIAPRWLVEGEGGLVLTSLGLTMDAVVEHARQGARARFPELAPADALPAMGRDRRIRRGLSEPADVYRVRLLNWIDDWKVAGNPYALMKQLRAFIGVDLRCRTVDNRGNWYTIDEDGTRSFLLNQGNWDWDDSPEKWSRFWVILYPPPSLWTQGPTIGDPDLWGGAIGTPGYTIGSTATPEQVAGVKSIVREWKPAGTRCVRIIVAFDGSYFDPTDAIPPNPDGTWDIASHRLPLAAYWNPNG